ncbi:glycosyltransferase 87 family protein [Nocardioides marmoribigeumensis]|uniref:Alpha-1,2-mannosyltransferase n=1 Tax=Nocardioides marmoribigeumensis TaxID=433649 RepID=A0ABU2BT50_9ACTN|nr:glycosyltransferase 87 family protein [Nocardioides marmoribigeumensis]MDR7360529.1 alpha-1,2-mannosyltransferase [Nocardioides marmoribigeumensis]
MLPTRRPEERLQQMPRAVEHEIRRGMGPAGARAWRSDDPESSRRASSANKPWYYLSVAAISLALGLLFSRIPFNAFDLQIYWRVGEVFRHGPNEIYSFSYYGLGLTYPPFAALVFAGLSYIPFAVVTVAAKVVQFALLAACLHICVRATSWSVWWVLPLTLAASALEPIYSGIILGQINLLLLVLILWDLTRPKETAWAGILLGLAIGIKLTPAIFLLYLVAHRDYRTAMRALLTFATTVVIGFVVAPGPANAYWTKYLFDTERIGPSKDTDNQSIRGMLDRLEVAHAGLIWVLACGALCALYLWWSQRPRQRADMLLEISGVGLLGCLVSPLSWSHHWAWIVPAAVAFVGSPQSRESQVRRLAIASAAWLLFLLPVARYRAHMPQDVPVAWLVLMENLYVLGTLIAVTVWGVMRTLRRRHWLATQRRVN